MSLVTRDILGIAVTSAPMDEMIAHLNTRLASGDRLRLAFLNAHTSNVAAKDAAFKAALDGFLILNDGVGVDIAARRLHGHRFPENLNGTDFVPAYLQRTQTPLRIYLLGGKPGIAEEAAAKLESLAPQHAIVGTRDGYFPPETTPGVVAAIAGTRPDILLVAFGNPAQELFIARHFDALGCRMAVGVGALLDFLSGRVVRAPGFFRAARMEWVWRLMREPGRLWRRYLLGNSQFLWRVIRKG
ncbi:MAG: WecB/TagA/CpsF family glycosyltransferase [Micropepsaceae bacterium]